MSTPHVLLIETREGATVAVRFASIDLARDFEDQMGLNAIGCVPLLTQTAAILQGVAR